MRNPVSPPMSVERAKHAARIITAIAFGDRDGRAMAMLDHPTMADAAPVVAFVANAILDRFPEVTTLEELALRGLTVREYEPVVAAAFAQTTDPIIAKVYVTSMIGRNN